MDDPWVSLNSASDDPEPHFTAVDEVFEGTSHTIALYQVNQPSFGMRIRFSPGGRELGVRILETLPGSPAAVANRLAGQRYADGRAAGTTTGPFQGLSAGNAIISVMTSLTNGQRTFSNTPAAIASALCPPQTGLTLVRVAQDLHPDLCRPLDTRGHTVGPSEPYVTLSV